MSRRERLRFRVARLEGVGALAPSDEITAQRLRDRGYRIGDTVLATVSKPRSTGFHRLAHAMGQMAVDHLPGFEELDAHQALKRLQFEAGVGCEDMSIRSVDLWGQVIDQIREVMGDAYARVLREGLREQGVPEIPVRVPRSLSYESMDQGEFEAVMRAIARHIARTYWPEMDEDDVLEMADVFPEEAVA